MERMQIVEAWMATCRESGRQNIKVFVHVGCSNLMETAQMARHAQDHGADGIAMVSTFYFRPKSIHDLVDQCAYVAASAPELPFYYYNIPSLTGVNFPLIDFIKLAVERIPNFAGFKNSSNDVVDYQHCLHYAKGRYNLYWGADEAFMMLYAAGNRHYVGSTYNYMMGYYAEMLSAHNANDVKTFSRLQEECDAIYRILSEYNGIIAGKEIMRLTGVDCGPVRIPLRDLTVEQKQDLNRKLKETTFFQQKITEREPATLL
jgi:N-acetylneuraminate lyase